MNSATSGTVEDSNDSMTSSGYSSLMADTHCKNCENVNAAMRLQEQRHNYIYAVMKLQIQNEQKDRHEQIEKSERTIRELKNLVQSLEDCLHQALLELGQLDYQIRKEANIRKRTASFLRVYSPRRQTAQTTPPQIIESYNSATSTNTTHAEQRRQLNISNTSDRASRDSPSRDAPQRAETLQSGSKEPCLQRDQYFDNGEENDTATGSMNSLTNRYRTLLLTMGDWLLSSESSQLKDWARQKLSIDVIPDEATNVLFHLDKEKVIGASNLSELRGFFESIERFDFVYIIDECQVGNYDVLKAYVR